MIYFDHNATTPMDPSVLEAMLPWLTEQYGNPHAAYRAGLMAEGALVNARAQVASLIGAEPAEVVFTSGGTESLNHAFKGVWEAHPRRRHLVVSAVEHSAVMAIGAWLQAQGGTVSLVSVQASGALDMAALRRAITPETALVSVMTANNETGVCFPVAEIAAIAHEHGALFHTDAIQAVGRIPVDVRAWGVDLLSLSGHKLYGPKGTGALFIRRGVRLKPLLHGGDQERGRRGGTENVPGLVGLGQAAALAAARLEDDGARIAALRDRLEAGLGAAEVHGRLVPRLPNTTLASFPGIDGEALLLLLDQAGFCVSTGSACTTGRTEPSHVLRAMGVDANLAKGTVRLSLGRGTTPAEVDALLEIMPSLLRTLREGGKLR